METEDSVCKLATFSPISGLLKMYAKTDECNPWFTENEDVEVVNWSFFFVLTDAQLRMHHGCFLPCSCFLFSSVSATAVDLAQVPALTLK